MISGNRLVSVAIVAAGMIAAPSALAAGPTDTMDPCAARANRIDADIAKAKAKGNDAAVANLERARSEMAHCSVDGLKERRKMALEQAQRRVDLSAADSNRLKRAAMPQRSRRRSVNWTARASRIATSRSRRSRIAVPRGLEASF